MNEHDLLMALEIVSEGKPAVASQSAAKEVFGTESFRRATARVEEKSRPWVLGEGIQGLGLGEKITKGGSTGELALRVYVDRKRAKAAVSNPVPKEVSLPELGKAQTDVVEIGVLEAESFTSRVRPAMPGCGVSHPDVSVGTFGCLVRKRGEDQGLYILSNSHVLADEGVAHVGDDIVQPGILDGGTLPADVIGSLTEFVPFIFTANGFPNLMDAAIARVRRRPSVTDLIRILGYAPRGVGRVLRRGMPVKKVGRTTDFTTGIVNDVHFRFSLDYKLPGHRSQFYGRAGHRNSGRVGFRDQVLCTRYTAGGDSGSAVLNRYGRVIGLHFAGSPSTSIFSPIRTVFRRLRLRLA